MNFEKPVVQSASQNGYHKSENSSQYRNGSYGGISSSNSSYMSSNSSISSGGDYSYGSRQRSSYDETDVVDLLSTGWAKISSGVKSIAEKIRDSSLSDEIDSLGRKLKDGQGWESVTSFFSGLTESEDTSYRPVDHQYDRDHYSHNADRVERKVVAEKKMEVQKPTPKQTPKQHFDDWDDDSFESFDKSHSTISNNTVSNSKSKERIDQSTKNIAKTDSFEGGKAKAWDDWDDWD